MDALRQLDEFKRIQRELPPLDRAADARRCR